MAFAILLIALMVLYAFSLRPAGFLISTTLFLVMGSAALGERRLVILCHLCEREHSVTELCRLVAPNATLELVLNGELARVAVDSV